MPDQRDPFRVVGNHGKEPGREKRLLQWRVGTLFFLTTVAAIATAGFARKGLEGGGLFVRGYTTATVAGSTLHGNTAGFGGGISNGGELTVTNSTLSGNTAFRGGGGLGLFLATARATLTHVTVTDNRGDADGDGSDLEGGIGMRDGVLTLHNTLVAGNVRGTAPGGVPSDISGTVTPDSSHNLIGAAANLTGISHSVAGNLIGDAANSPDPRLAPLSDNGGATLTHNLLPGSPAIDAGAASPVSPTDQRGQPRGATPPDIGAVELVRE